MSKKKRKNSNYKNSSAEEQAVKDLKKNRTILIVCAVLTVLLIGGIIAGIVSSSSKDTGGEGNEYTDKIAYVEMDFGEYGKIVIEVNGKEAPITANNFMKLVNSGFYDGLTIFRAQANFVIQGGKNESVKLDPIEGEFSSNGHKNSISHLRGAISMARTNDPDSATSQFFISLDDSATSSLDGKYAAFGRVVEGMSVVDAIANALMSCKSDYMGFVSDADAVKIVSAKELKNYKK